MRCNWFDTQPAAARNFPGRVIKKERKKRRKGEREREREREKENQSSGHNSRVNILFPRC